MCSQETSDFWKDDINSNRSILRNIFYENFSREKNSQERLVSVGTENVSNIPADFSSMSLKMGLKSKTIETTSWPNFIPFLLVNLADGSTQNHCFDQARDYRRPILRGPTDLPVGHLVNEEFVKSSEVLWASLHDQAVFYAFRAGEKGLLQYDISTTFNPILFHTFKFILSEDRREKFSGLRLHFGVMQKFGECLRQMPYFLSIMLQFQFSEFETADAVKAKIRELQDNDPLPQDCGYVPPPSDSNNENLGSVYFQYLFPCPPHGNCEEG